MKAPSIALALGPDKCGVNAASVLRWGGLIALLLLLGAFYLESWQTLVRVWNTPAYNHGYVIPLVALWLIWRARARVATVQARTDRSALVGIALLGLLWLAGELSGVNAARHFAIIGMVVLLVPLVFGWPVARSLMFPLGFVFFAVPFGEFMTPMLMQVTASMTIALVRLSGVPIYQEGLSFVLPSGSWEVVDECSGQRYLIAALPLACLFAWMTYRDHRTRLLFVLLAVVVALLANWLRAWGIVMLGHLSSMTIATGVDHLIYGWLFFGIVMGVLFWFGLRWADSALPSDLPPGKEQPRIMTVSAAQTNAGMPASNAKPYNSRHPGRIVGVLVAGALVLTAWPWLSTALFAKDSAPLDLARLAGEISDFSLVSRDRNGTERVDAFKPAYQGARQEVRLARNDVSGDRVSVWIGAYEHQQDGREMIQHANAIRIRSMNAWTIVAERSLPPNEVSAGAKGVEYAVVGSRERYLVWRTFFVDGVLTGSEATAKLLTAWRLLRGDGDRSIAAILWTRLDGDEAAGRRRLAQALDSLTPALAAEGR